MELLSEIVFVIGIPCFFIFGTWLLCLNLVELRDKGFVQSVKNEWSNAKSSTGKKVRMVAWSMVFFCVALIPAYISEYVVGQASPEAPLWVQVFVGIGVFGFWICILAALFVSGNKTDKD